MEMLIKIIGVLTISFVVRAFIMQKLIDHVKDHPHDSWMIPFADSVPTIITILLSILFF